MQVSANLCQDASNDAVGLNLCLCKYIPRPSLLISITFQNSSQNILLAPLHFINLHAARRVRLTPFPCIIFFDAVLKANCVKNSNNGCKSGFKWSVRTEETKENEEEKERKNEK
jgi:hypothetical protein